MTIIDTHQIAGGGPNEWRGRGARRALDAAGRGFMACKLIPSPPARCLPGRCSAPRSAIRKLSIGFVGLFLVTDLATRLNRVGRREADASDATPEIAGPQEKYSIGTVDWAVIDASGTPGQTLKQCQTRLAHCEAAQDR